MTRIHFIQHDGSRCSIDAEAGRSVMQAALEHLVPGIVGECGGYCSCATCHAYIAPAWESRVPVARPDEAQMLEGAIDVRPNSRLTCQIMVVGELDGLELHLPERQL